MRPVWNGAALAALLAAWACGGRAAAGHGGGRVEGISALGTARPFEALLKK